LIDSLVVKDQKTGYAPRTVALPQVALAGLRRQQERVDGWRQQAGQEWQPSAFIFPKRLGGPRDDHAAREKLKNVCRELGLPVLRFHDLRHLSATLMLGLGIHPKIVQQRVGHASISMTMDTYSHVVRGMDQEAALKLDGVMMRTLADKEVPGVGPVWSSLTEPGALRSELRSPTSTLTNGVDGPPH
jgi:integrase